MRAAVLIRTGSVQAGSHLAVGSSRGPAADRDPGAGVSFLRRSPSAWLSPRSPVLHVDAKGTREIPSNLLRRARSEADMIGSGRPNRTWPRSPLPEEEVVERKGRALDVGGFLTAGAAAVVLKEEEQQEEEEEVQYSGGGIGNGRKIGGGNGGGDQNENRRIGDYYQGMLKADPGNPLLLRNYGRFLHEVEGDVRGAEEYYSRAILASPGDGEVLSLYGKLVWETHGDGARAEAYFERAVEASPDDCFVLGSYAKFLWDAEEEEEEEDEGKERSTATPSRMLEAF